MHFASLEQLLPKDHRARLVWDFVLSLDLSAFYAKIKVAGDVPGQAAIAPEVLVTLWLMATLDGIGSARELERRCEKDFTYLWILGGVTVNYHTLSDFRGQNAEWLEQLLTQSVATLINSGVVSLDTIAQDGMRVRANAGGSSFRRQPTLLELEQEARAHVERLRKEGESETSRQAGDARRRAAEERAARERQERIDEALRQMEELSAQREARKKGDGETTRTSTTDPEARKMKMANGGYNPAYNVQFATDGDSRIIVAVDVTNEGTDGGELPPMLEQIEKDYGQRPQQVLVDSAYATKDSVTAAEQAGTKVISTVPRSEQLIKHGKDPHEKQRRDTDEYATFRARMADPANQELYKQRPSMAEFPNAFCRNHNLHQFTVRGQLKAKAVAIWYALAFNFQRMLTLGVFAT